MDEGLVTVIGMSIAYVASFIGMGLAWWAWKRRVEGPDQEADGPDGRDDTTAGGKASGGNASGGKASGGKTSGGNPPGGNAPGGTGRADPSDGLSPGGDAGPGGAP